MSISLEDLETDKSAIKKRIAKIEEKIVLEQQILIGYRNQLQAINLLIQSRSSSDITCEYIIEPVKELKLNEACLEAVNSTREILRPVDVENILKDKNYPFKSKTPICSIALALQNLEKQEKIKKVSEEGSKNKYRRTRVRQPRIIRRRLKE